MSAPLPYATDPDAIRLRIEAKVRNPSVGRVVSATIRNGPKVFRFATLYEIVNKATGAHHHYCLRLDSFRREKATGWQWQKERSLTIDNDKSSELSQLGNIVQSALAGTLQEESGDYQLVRATDAGNLKDLLRLAKSATSPARMRLIEAIVQNLDPEAVSMAEWLAVFERGASGLNQAIAASARLVEYLKVRDRLVSLVEATDTKEQAFQELLASSPWVFGSEYSTLMERRTWTRDDRFDFMLRRTVDNYLEVVEIKTANVGPLFVFDKARDAYAPSAALSRALGQTMRYLEEVDRARDSIIAKDNVDPLKMRARLIIGRDGDPAHQAALRNLNAHLYRIEILTFDQLVRTVERVLAVFQSEPHHESAGQDSEWEDFPTELGAEWSA